VGKKKWDPDRPITSDYMDVKTNIHQHQYREAIQRLFGAGGDTHVDFADALVKVNRRGASQVQVVVATDQHIYKYAPKKYTMIKQGIPFTAVRAVHLTNLQDTFMVIEMDPPYRDMVLDLGTNGCERYSELTAILYQRRKELGRVIDVTFAKNIKFNNSRRSDHPGADVLLNFEPHSKPIPGCKFKGPNKSVAVVYYDPGYDPQSF